MFVFFSQNISKILVIIAFIADQDFFFRLLFRL